ncbi:hypothetical protein GCM10023088_12860 [Actinomadura verrucosospora]|uniref:hypothetical protein n=1 Tax=Actinomadura verrucosospora TaxID=46165 RepID=UPI0031EF53EC
MHLSNRHRLEAALIGLLAVVCAVALAAGSLALALTVSNATLPVMVKDWGICQNGAEVRSWSTPGTGTPNDGVIIEPRVQPGCSFVVKDENGRSYRQVIRSHRYVVVKSRERTFTRLVDGRNPADCRVGKLYSIDCLHLELPSTGASSG